MQIDGDKKITSTSSMPFQFECYSLNVAARMAQRSAGEGW